MVEGICRGYLQLIILNTPEIDLSYVSAFILKRIDNLVEGLLESSEEPVLHEERLGEFLCSSELIKEQVKEHFLSEIIVFKRTLADQLENDELLVTLDVLEAEMRLQNPRIPVIQGMLSNLEVYPSLNEFRLRTYGILQYKKVTMMVFIVTFFIIHALFLFSVQSSSFSILIVSFTI